MREKKIPRKKLKKHEVQYHVLSKKKDDDKTYNRMQLKVVWYYTCKQKWIRKDILRNSMRLYMCCIIVKGDFNVSIYCDFIEKWLEYYTCRECEDEVNRKGHLTKLQEAVHVDNVKYIKSEQNIILPILKHVWTKRRSLARIAGELEIKKTMQL